MRNLWIADEKPSAHRCNAVDPEKIGIKMRLIDTAGTENMHRTKVAEPEPRAECHDCVLNSGWVCVCVTVSVQCVCSCVV